MKLTHPLLEPDNGGQGGGGGAAAGGQQTAAALFGEGGGEGQQAAGGEGQAGGGEGQGQGQGAEGQQGGAAGGQQQQQAQPTLTLDQVQSLIKSFPMAQQQQQQAPQMTEEEFNKIFNVYNPDESLVQALRHEDPQQVIAGLKTAFQGLVRQAATISAYQMMQEVQKLQQQVAPALKYAQEQELSGLKTEFFKTYPNLQGLEPLLLQIRDAFKAQNRNFASKDEAFKAVADEANRLIEQIPGLKAALQAQSGGGQGAAAGQGGQQGRRMPALSGKGQGGGANGGAAAGTKSTAQRIFG